MSEYVLVLILFENDQKMIKILNKKIKHISWNGVSSIFIVWDLFLQLIFLVSFG